MALGSMRAAWRITAVCLALGGPAFAASDDRAAIYAQLLANPGDVELTIQYAELSRRAGDFEAAIGALERVLFFRPDEPNARLYLGMLYGALGSHDMARGYYESVLQHPATPEPIRARAAYLLGKAEKRLSPHQWTSYVRTGVRWQSNANGEPDGSYTSFSPTFYNDSPPDGEWLTEPGDPASDWNAYLNSGVAYAYDFGNQRGDRFEATLTTYSTRHLDFDEFNYNQVEATAGVRFGIPTDHPTEVATLKPFLTAGGALLDEEPYFAAGGIGLAGTLPVGSWTLGAYADAIWREYSDDFAETAEFVPDEFQGATGPVYSAGFRFASNPYSSVRVEGHAGYERRDVSEDGPFDFMAAGATYTYSGDYLSYDRFVAEVRLPFDLEVNGHQLLVTPLAAVRWTSYDEPDPFVQDLSSVTPVEREDVQYRIGVAVDYAITDWAGIGAQVLYTTTDSNLAAYDTDNLAVSFGPHFRF